MLCDGLTLPHYGTLVRSRRWNWTAKPNLIRFCVLPPRGLGAPKVQLSIPTILGFFPSHSGVGGRRYIRGHARANLLLIASARQVLSYSAFLDQGLY
jgi:hypothetical protein